MKKYLKKYSDQNPERFNKDFILSREKQDVLEYVNDIFKTLEVLDEVKVEEVTIERDEATYGPIKFQHHYYKSILPSRLDKIHYRIRITPTEDIQQIVPIELGKNISEDKSGNEQSFVREGDIYINKLVDNCFYINEGVRYFLIYQIVDNTTYGTDGCVSLKSLLMPITIRKIPLKMKPSAEDQTKLIVSDRAYIPEYGAEPSEPLCSYETLLFSKKVNPLLYILGKDSYNALAKLEVTNKDVPYNEWIAYRDPSLITKLNNFFGTDIKFSDNRDDLVEEGRTVYRFRNEKPKDGDGCYFSVDSNKLNSDSLTRAVVGCLLNIQNEVKKKRITPSYDQLTSPWFWIDTLSSFFTKNNDYMKKINKIKTMLISLNRLMDETNRKILNLSKKDKENTLTIIRYIMANFDKLMDADSKDLDDKRLRLFEYQLYPLRKYFSDQIYRVLNSPTRSKVVLDRIFSNLNPMYVIKSTITSELLRYYNSTNDLNLYSAFLKYTFRGPQSLNKTVTMEQRDLHPSYTGRLSLIASSASDPGMSGTLTPFVEVYDYYFKKQKKDK
jgi:hypothetical protein